ncbi:MAG: hypothetical protein WAU17_05030, partial [Nitrospirales bacterium]
MNVHTAGLCRAILAVLSTSMLLLGCSTGVRTPINQTPNSNIYLEWVQQDSFHASHPATLSPTIIRETLRGVRIQEQKSGLGELVSGQQNPKRIFSDEDVKLLLPHILTALSEATPEEHVVFQRLYP